jgi:flagellar biosynthesis component FlhA
MNILRTIKYLWIPLYFACIAQAQPSSSAFDVEPQLRHSVREHLALGKLIRQTKTSTRSKLHFEEFSPEYQDTLDEVKAARGALCLVSEDFNLSRSLSRIEIRYQRVRWIHKRKRASESAVTLSRKDLSQALRRLQRSLCPPASVGSFNDLDFSSNILMEGTVGTVGIKAQAIDPNPEDAVSYSIISGNQKSRFSIDPTSGVVSNTAPVFTEEQA